MSIRYEKVNFEYSPNTPFAFKALSDIDLELAEGKITAIIGATGSGKTTLVQHLNGLLIPTSGTIYVADEQINAGEKLKIAKRLRSKVGLVFQFAEYQLFEETLIKDVAFGPKNFGVSEADAEQIAREALKFVGISEADFNKSPLELSGGQKRRVAIAGIIAMKPKVLVLDEPTAGLDPQGAKEMMTLFKNLNKSNGTTVLMVTHNMEHVLDYCDEVVVMELGKNIMHTDTRTFFENVDYMNRALIDPPVIVKFKQLCAQRGVDFSSEALSIDALVNEIVGGRKR